MSYHFIIVHILFCVGMDVRDRTHQSKQVHKLLKKNTHVNSRCVSLQLTKFHKLENKIQPQ